MIVIWLLIALGLIIMGASWLVEGASSIARKAGMSEFVIGLTIVGFGTSCPELVVSLTGAFESNADIAVGNVIGSNIFNVLFILGLTALICPVSMSSDNRKIDIPVTLTVTTVFLVLGLNHTLWGIGQSDRLSRLEGFILIAAFAAYIIQSFRSGKSSDPYSSESKPRKLYIAIFMVIAGLAGLIIGGNLFVDSATDIARMVGVSDKFIAVTILAGGTSLPELATSIVAALKSRDQLALGNILGSNVFNILLILGTSAIITPLSLSSVTYVDALVLLISMILLLLWAYTGQKERIDRLEGALMLMLFGAYYTYLFIKL